MPNSKQYVNTWHSLYKCACIENSLCVIQHIHQLMESVRVWPLYSALSVPSIYIQALTWNVNWINSETMSVNDLNPKNAFIQGMFRLNLSRFCFFFVHYFGEKKSWIHLNFSFNFNQNEIHLFLSKQNASIIATA